MTELSGAADRVPLEALHRLENSCVKEGGYCKVLSRVPWASPPTSCWVPTVVREALFPCFHETEVVRMKSV